MRVARRVARKKPIVVLKTGRTQQSAKAAQSHTGSMTGNDEIWDAVIKQCGLIRADSIDEMSDLLKFFSYMPVIQGRGVGIVSFSGGLGIHSIDFCEKYGLDVVELSTETRQNIVDLAPPWLGVGNPLDLWPVIMVSRHPIVEALRNGLHIVMKDQNVHAAILVLPAWMERMTPSLTDVLLEVAGDFPKKAMVLCPYEGWVYNVFRAELEEKLQKTGKILVLPASDRAAMALGKAAEYSEFLSKGSQQEP
jgi:acetyltransferase